MYMGVEVCPCVNICDSCKYTEKNWCSIYNIYILMFNIQCMLVIDWWDFSQKVHGCGSVSMCEYL